MTFKIGPDGVENTEDTKAKFSGGGSVRIGGNFTNSGKVKIDIKARLDILGNVVNSGDFNILDFTTKDKYTLFENAIKDLKGEAKIYTQDLYLAVQNNKPEEAKSKFSQLISYLKLHPELVTSSVQLLLQIF